MSRNRSSFHLWLLLLVVLLIFLSENGVYAFGAGNIPSFAFLEGRAFRHGDIEDTLGELAKKSASGFALGALIGKGGSKFGGLDTKRVYFGNWLRDYSQAVDVAGLQKLQLQTIINLCMALGFLAHGYATNEFEVTEDRLAVYLPTEHIDNPKGYPDDARKYHPKLRGPVDPRELDIDPYTGMKNYIANENGPWDTSKALVRRTLEQCIHLGRQNRANGRKEDLYEAYRLLGQAMHTLEDFPAHSNFCELALVSLGYKNVFVHVGDQVRIQARNGQWVAPLVTGTFGSSDFIHSLLGEATDHIASVTDLNAELDKARAKSNDRSQGGTRSGSGPADALRNLLFTLPTGDGDKGEMEREMQSIERIGDEPNQGGKRPEDMSPQELHSVLWQVLSFRDSVVKKIEKTIEKIPGLGPLIEKIMDSISVFVFTTLEPFLRPIMKQATTGLMAASGEVINSHDQYEVFNDPRASDPTHSFLSKDHFNLILNEPAGNLAKIIFAHSVRLIVQAWDDTSMNVHGVTEDILQCLFHPDFHDSNSKIQREMMEYMAKWVRDLGPQQQEVLNRLTKDAVREHKNIRLGGQGGSASNEYSYATNAGHQAQQNLQGYLSQVPVVGSAASFLGKLDNARPGGSSSSSHGPFSGFGQAQNVLSQFTGGGFNGPRRDVAQAPSGRPPTPPRPESPRYNTGFPGAGYGPGSHHGGGGHHKHSSSGGGPSSYAPPQGPPPSFPGAPSHEGYHPSYGSESGYGQGNYGGGGGAGFPEPTYSPGGYAPPPGGPPGFPNPAPGGGYPPPPGPPPGQGYNAPPGPPPGQGYGGYGGGW
ncbi:Het-C-domain-containing protein [Panus rudis PR-1116 ss-1]|nr:Het-C-domain-containing protein [Panus rudis PR-1116 ss-1]